MDLLQCTILKPITFETLEDTSIPVRWRLANELLQEELMGLLAAPESVHYIVKIIRI